MASSDCCPRPVLFLRDQNQPTATPKANTATTPTASPTLAPVPKPPSFVAGGVDVEGDVLEGASVRAIARLVTELLVVIVLLVVVLVGFGWFVSSAPLVMLNQ